jgi:hypothetical protein
MATNIGVVRNWIGGGSNNIFAASDWSPSGAPQPGDTLVIRGGVANMAGGNLTAETVYLGSLTEGSATPPPAVLDLSGGAHIAVTMGVAPGDPPAFAELGSAIINVAGTASLQLTEQGGRGGFIAQQAAVVLAPGALLKGGFNLTESTSLSVTGGAASRFDNNGTSVVGGNAVAHIDVATVGVGSTQMQTYATLDFAAAVSSGQTVRMAPMSHLEIDQPTAFAGTVQVADWTGVVVDLSALAADSWRQSGNTVAVMDGGQVMDRLHVSGGGGFQLAAHQGGVELAAAGSALAAGDHLLTHLA